jgi:Radical SAM superfamily
MLIRPKILAILTTRRCTAACDHCSVGASPTAADAIPVERIHRLIDEATEVPSLDHIGFTGGECFLLGRDLDALVEHAAVRGFVARAITNGYWAASPRSARARMQALRDRGLAEIMFSTGTFHQTFVPVARVIAGARAAAEAGVVTRISVETCDQSRFDANLIRAELAELVETGKIVISVDPWIEDAGGRGRTAVTNDGYFASHGVRDFGGCAQIMKVISVTQNQQLVACCGFPSEKLPGLHIGSVKECTLRNVLSRAPDELMKMWLHVAGPQGIASFVARYIPGYELAPAASICQSCASLHRDSRVMDVVARHGSEAASAIAAHYLSTL